jgi:hypothetical protein
MSRTLEFRTAIWLILLSILAGLVLGAMLDRLAFEYHFRHRMHGRMEQHLLVRLQKDLALTPVQQAQVDSVLRQQGNRIERLRGEVEHLFAARQDSFETELAKVLTPAQLQKLHRMIPGRPPGMLPFGLWPGGPHRGDGPRGEGHPGDGHSGPPPPPTDR